MSWITVDEKHKKRFDKEFVSCEELYERRFIIDAILEQFIWLSHAEVTEAVNQCCKAIPPPRPREKFIQYLKNRLE